MAHYIFCKAVVKGRKCGMPVVSGKEKLCPLHKNWKPTRRKKLQQSSAARGYGYQYRKARLIKLKEVHYMCEECGTKAVNVDHITPISKGGTNDQSNLRAYCLRCHLKKHGKLGGL